MRKFLLLVLFLLSLIACSSKKNMAKKYLDSNFPEFAPWEILEVGETDSLATPFMELGCIGIQLAQLSGSMIKAYSMEEFEEINEKAKVQEEYLQQAAEMLDNPEGPNKNRLGFKATVKGSVSDKEYTAYFFLNNDGTIGHTNLDLNRQFDEVMKDLENFWKTRATLTCGSSVQLQISGSEQVIIGFSES